MGIHFSLVSKNGAYLSVFGSLLSKLQRSVFALIAFISPLLRLLFLIPPQVSPLTLLWPHRETRLAVPRQLTSIYVTDRQNVWQIQYVSISLMGKWSTICIVSLGDKPSPNEYIRFTRSENKRFLIGFIWRRSPSSLVPFAHNDVDSFFYCLSLPPLFPLEMYNYLL